ncbi:MAG: hypothetical protein LBJ31_05990 [Treponema sp.]|nr:hypothetical protein [Treponema sp.]
MTKDNSSKAKDVEEYFSKYLDSLHIPFYHIDPGKNTYSNELGVRHIKRPDYIIHTKRGVFYIDVKLHKKMGYGENGEKRFYLTYDDIQDLFGFEAELNSPVWIAFTENQENQNIPENPEFFYAPIFLINEYYDSLMKIYEEKYSKKYNEKFYDYIYIPYELLDYRLSFDKGFYKEADRQFLEKEAVCHNVEKEKRKH